MHKYCLDTSGLSNPFVDMPPNIYSSLWVHVVAKVQEHVFCWNTEIFEELTSIPDPVGASLKGCNGSCCHEVGFGSWPWQDYLDLINDWRVKYKDYISDYNGGRKNTIGLNDLSIVALAKVLSLPVVSMEKKTAQTSAKRMKIPDLCAKESVGHLSFNDFLVAEGIKI